MANRRQREVGEEDQRAEAGDAAGEEIFVVEAADAAVEKEVVVVAADDAAFAHLAVISPGWNVLAAAQAAVAAVVAFRLVRLGSFLVRHQQRHLVVLFDGLRVAQAVHRRSLMGLEFKIFLKDFLGVEPTMFLLTL